MKITETKVTVAELSEKYHDDGEKGVFGFNNTLVIRPAYQREFIYEDRDKKAVVDSILKGFPLSLMYWAKTKENNYEVLDGQQRTISICQFINNDYTIEFDNHNQFFSGLPEDAQQQILNYTLSVYLCEGTESELLNWFRVINIAGKPLTDQELLNAAYTGTWLSDAKKYFSASNCAAYRLAKDYVDGKPLRQDYLAKTLEWIAAKENTTVDHYMAQHQQDDNAGALWNYFNGVITWVKTNFPTYRKEMKGVQWGLLYNKYFATFLNTSDAEAKIKDLMEDEEVGNKKGIYEYLFTHNEKSLNLRTFSDKLKREAYERQNGECARCHQHFELDQMEGDHIEPWSKGGKTVADNLQMLCRKCNNEKSNK